MMKSLCNIEMRKLEHVILRDFAINFEMKKKITSLEDPRAAT